ncbi:hypothetical protein ACFROC_12190 [Nocardia tengchongensis]|uniref:hypothetical protein n=1 Tax=Nocardia tengchongensis TaxID=2055889 RepID=UPI0036BD02B5
MPATHRRARHIAWAATLLSVAGTLTTLSSAVATAGIHGIEVQECSDRACTTPASYIVGQSYSVIAPYDGTSTQSPVSSFYDNGACLGSATNSVTWVPLTAGTHTLSTRGGSFTDSVTVTVVAAPPGTPTPQQPQQGGCGGGGSFGSGSSNLLPGS